MIIGQAKSVARSQELVFLDADDDLGTIRSKLESTTADEIFVVVARHSPVLRTPLEYRMLARIANELSAELVVVTEDGNRRRMARQEGFRTKRSLRTLRYLLLSPGEEPPAFVIPDWVPIPSLANLASAVAAAAFILAVAAVAYPQMRVSVVPQATRVTKTLDLVLDPDAKAIDVERGVLPGEVLTQRFEVAGALPVPSERTVGKDKARGEILLTSQQPDAQVLPAGTQVMVPGGPKFATDQDVRLVPRLPVRVGITAVAPGTGSNVDPGRISALADPSVASIQVTNQRPTAGGSDRQAKVVTDDDVSKLRDQLTKQARDQAYQQFRIRVGADRSLPEQALKVRADGEQFDQAPGAETEQLTGRLQVTASAIAYQSSALSDLLGKMLAVGVGPSTRPSGDVDVQGTSVVGLDGARVKLRSQASALVVQTINRDEVLQALRGRSAQDAQAYLARMKGLAEAPRVQISPDWAPRAFRIDLTVLPPR